MNALQIQLSTTNVGFGGLINYNGEEITAEGKTKNYIKARLAKLLSKKSVEGVTFTFNENIANIEMAKKEIKPKQKIIDIETLQLFSNPNSIAGDKAKFYYDKEKTDCAIVDIIKIEEAKQGGWYIYWIFENETNREKFYRTYVRKGGINNSEQEFIVGTTITAAMIKNIVVI